MRILLTTAQPLLPQSCGGLQSAIHELALILSDRAEAVSVLCGLTGEGILGLRARVMMTATGKRSALDRRLGYPVHRALSVPNAIAEVVYQEKPDVAVIYANDIDRIVPQFQALRVPIVISLRIDDLARPAGTFAGIHCEHFISDTEYTARAFAEKFKITSTVVNHVVLPDLHRVTSSLESVTIFDPALGEAGNIGLRAAARCQEIPFVFVEYEPLDESQRAMLLDAMRNLPNTRFAPVSTLSQEVFEHTRFLLAPGRGNQSFTRIVAESQVSGIPVIACKHGPMPEAVGSGGILIEPDATIDAWVEAIRRLWSDQRYYAELSANALNHAKRPEIDPKIQADRLIAALQTAIAAQATSRGPASSLPRR